MFRVVIAVMLACQISHSAEPETTVKFTLEEAIYTALESNPDLQIMRERISQAQAQVGETLANFYPQIKSRLSYEHTDNPSRAFGMIISQRRLDFNGTNFNHPGGVDNYRPELMATYSLFNGGQDYQNSKAAELGVSVASLQESAVRNQLIELVTSAFYGILAAEEAHNIAMRSITAVDSELKQTRLRYAAGTALKSDVLTLEVQLAEARDNEIHAASAIAIAESGFKTLLGISSDQPVGIVETPEQKIPELTPAYPELIDKALAQRPEIKAVNEQIAIAEHKLQAAKGGHLPKADAYVTYGSDSKNLAYSTSRDNVTAGITVSMDIFSGFASSERIKKAEREVNIAKLAAQQTRLAIEDELKSAYLKLKDALDRMQVTAASVTAAKEALRLVNLQRAAGIETVTRYIEAEVAHDKAQSRHVAARYDALRAEAELKKALGAWSKGS